MKIASYVIKGIRYDVPVEIMVKGGPGSGVYIRYKATPVELEEATRKLAADQLEDYIEHMKYGTPHEFAMGLAEKQPKSSYAMFREMNNMDMRRER